MAARRGYGLHVVCTRAFDHTSSGRDPRFALGAWAHQIAEIEAGHREPVVKHGNLDAVRDICDARDVARAYVLALEKCSAGEAYNICRGQSWSMGDVLRMLAMLSTETVRLEPDPTRMRPADVPVLLGDSTKFCEVTGWIPEISLTQTLADLLYWCRAEVGARRAA